MGVFFSELNRLYRAYVSGEEDPLPELAVQYADYAVWQREVLQDPVLQKQVEYWRWRLEGLPVLELPTKGQRPARPSHFGAKLPVHLPPRLLARLKELARTEDATLFMVLLASFQLLLSRWTGQQDLAVGTPVANRTRMETESLIGFFVNTLVLRTDFSGSPNVRELVKQVREVCHDAYAHQDLPFDRLVEELNPHRELAQTVLFQVMFGLQSVPIDDFHMEELTLEPLSQPDAVAKFDLHFLTQESDGGLDGSVTYATELFEAAMIDRMFRHWKGLLESMVVNPNQAISDLQMLEEEEIEQILVDWNRTEQPHSEAQCIQELFEAQVDRSPTATAIMFEDQQLSYHDLNERANQLAHYLRELGVGPEIPVGLCVERSLEMAVGLLGILKSGGTYVPLDPDYPADRLAFMLKDARSPVLITQGYLGQRMTEAAAHIVNIDDWAEIAKSSRTNPPVINNVENAAYVIYTSGSTGRPKGVVASHRGLANTLMHGLKAFAISSHDVMAALASFAFDISLLEMMTAWLGGGATLIVTRMDVRDVDLLLDRLKPVTVLHTVPSLMGQMIKVIKESAPGKSPVNLRSLLIGGDQVSADLLAEMHELFPHCEVRVLYGPTEATIICANQEMAAGTRVHHSPIGRPITNMQLYLLDGTMRPVPIGVTGELYIAGAGLARGYLRRADLTTERFVPNPFARRAGERLYRTGDLGRWREDGTIEFIGRADQQVKIRGHRIELGEIECALREHAQVSDAVVISRKDHTGQNYLAAYIVGAAKEEYPGAAKLRAHVQQRLPEYMVPSVFVEMKSLPLTPTGKLDRRALPAPEMTGGETGTAARTPVEEILCGMWAKLLGRAQVGVEDNFFELGGHSLLATQVTSRARQLFGVEMKLQDLFEQPTVAHLARIVEAAQKTGALHKAQPLVSVGRDGILPLSFAQQRLWFMDQLEPGSIAYTMPLAVRLVGHLRIDALGRALSEIVRRHEVLRTHFVVVDGHPVQKIEKFDAGADGHSLMHVDLSGLTEAEREDAMRRHTAEVMKPFDLSRGPLMRVRVLTLGVNDHALLLTMHHIIGDGWSLSVFMSEIAVLYEAFVQGQESPLPELEIQYADYASWQRAYLQGEVLERQLDYWRKQLANVPVLDLPTDRARPAVPSHKGAYVLLNLPPELLERLKKLSRQEGTTLFMVLLAAFQLLLARYSGQEDIPVGTDVANRTRTEVESLIGFFVNQLVLRVNTSKRLTVRKLLAHVRQVCLGAYAHQDLPFERLVQEMNPERSLSHTPLFQVKVLLQNMPSSPRPFAGVEMKSLDLVGGVSQFDLLLSLQEAGDVMVGHCTYATDLFDEHTVLRIIGHWTRLLEEIAADPKRAARDLEMLSEAERRQVLVEWNGNRQESGTGCVHDWFEQQVERTSRSTAVICGDQHWDYADLNERANRLARHLQELGVGPEMRVGLCVDRGLEMVVGILGILKAGGVYVPLDPGYPVERLAYMLEDAQIPVLLTQQALLGKLPASLAQVVCLDSDWSQVETQSGENLHVVLDARNAAYVIYTSGSTGKPKGVVVTHGGVVNLALAQIDKFAIREGSRVLQFASLSFDAAVSEWSTALLSGASLVVGSADRRWGATEVTRLAGEGKVSVVTLPPSVLAAFTEAELVGVETLVVAGEACSGELVRRWAAGRRMLNAYGPTETTVCASISRPLGPDGDCPIGVPLANMQVYVLDEYLQPAPIGVLGELYVGGAGLARGYLDRSDLTAERFVPSPYGGKAGERLYRTGDLGRWRGDGNLEFIRRADQQVKVRGYRIEPGEIEAALTGHPRVRDAVVIARVGESGQQRLVAYVVGREGKPPQAAELRTYLLSRLPEYLVPGLYVELEQLPLTANGKVDRQALPQPEKVRMKADREFKGPRTEAEKTLCEIWAKVLGLERVGVDDNFFELGGDSILSVQIVSRARESGLQLSVQQMFQYQTVAELAAEVQPVSAGSYLAPAPVIGEVPLTPIQSWFFEQVTAVPSHYNQSVMLTVPADVGPEVVETVLPELLRNHDAFRLRFSRQADGPWQQRCEEWQPGPSMLERFDFSVEPEQNRRALLEAEANRLQASLDLEKGPLLRAGWFELGRNERRLLLVVHHLAIDGVSWRILLGDLQALCSQASANQPLRLAYQSASFGQWAQALQEDSQSEAMKGEIEYWLQVIAHPALPVRRDLDAGADSMGSIAFVELRLSAEETQALLQQVPRVYHTQIQDVLVTALARGFEHWSGSKGLLLELEGHGREQLSTTVDVSRTVGWFTTIFPVYLQLTGGGPGEDLKAVKEQLRAIPRHGIGYGILRYLTAEGRSSLKMQSEVVFNYLGQFDQLLSDGGWNSAPESPGAMQNATQKRSHLLEINGAITGGHLQLAFAYSRNIHHEETIRTLAAACLGELQALIAHCCSAEGSFTPSDFPLVRITQKELDRISQGRKLEDLYPLSPMQEGMLFHTIEALGSGIYMSQLCLELEGAWDQVVFLRAAWEQVMKRHGVLRTSFVWEGFTRPLQRVEQAPELPWDNQDWRGLSTGEQRGKLEQYLPEIRTRGFDLAQAPLMRIGLVRIAEDRFYLVWTHHHLLLDGWSVARVLGEVQQFFDAYRSGEELQLPQPRPYRDYISWLERQDLDCAEGFWRELLKDFSSSTQLGIERRHSKSELTSTRFGRKRVPLDRKLADELGALVHQQRLTLNTFMQAGWGLLLSRYSDQLDVIFGATTAARPVDLRGAEEIVGLFINTLPVRLRLQDRDSVLDCLRRLQQEQIEARRYEYTPLVRIQSWSEVPPGQPLFQTLFVFESYPVAKPATGPQTGGMRALAASGEESTNYPLTATVIPGADLVLDIAYDRELFDAETVERMMGHWRRLLGAMVEHLEQPVLVLEMLDETERQQVVVEWNRTAEEYRHACIHELVEEQAAKRPEVLAVEYQGQGLSYGELNRRANQVGHYLRKLGIGPEVRVGICVERSLEMVIGLLGILKAGGAYVPLDPEYPAERLEYMVKDAQAAVLVTEKKLEEVLGQSAARKIYLEREWKEIEKESGADVGVKLDGGNPAYVIYTSGSTGRPKGVVIQHGALSTFLHGMNAQAGFNFSHTHLAVTTIGFDISILELFLPLCCGGRVVVASKEEAQDPAQLCRRLRSLAVNSMQATPSHWSMVLQADLDSLKGLRVLCGGEALSRELAQSLYRSTQGQAYNVYGPTEATIWASSHKIKDTDFTEQAPPVITIGSPLANYGMYVLDGRLKPCPVGVAGGLYIAGSGLALGYLNRPELTAECFVPNPFSQVGGERIYRTGDQARWQADGNLEFQGRLDHQVKLRGYRIELAEIEAALLEYATVKQAIVVAREEAGGKRLVGYVVGEDGAGAREMDLRGYLRRRLPEYMVPTVIVELDEMPLTPNGKVDRKRLPEPGYSSRREQMAPRNVEEEILCGIFAEVLKRERVGVEDSFFELGGHSLLAMQVISRIRSAFGVELPIRALFEAQTVAVLANRVKQERGEIEGAEPVVRDLGVEAILDANIVPLSQTPAAAPPENVFLTGASGFLGCFLLVELLKRTQATVHCLVRSSTPEEGAARISAELKSFDLWDATMADRIVAVSGDLSRPRLGLSIEQFETIANIVDAVYHCGAIVNAAYSYDLLKPANVLGTQEIIRMACLGRRKVLHYVSTIAVLPPLGDAEESEPVTEEALFERWQDHKAGYPQSKWVAEKLVRMAGSRGVPIAIYRPPFISGSPQNGAGNPTDFLSLFIRACLQLGCIPDIGDIEIAINMLPVDYLSHAIVALSLREDILGRCFNLVNDKTTSLKTVCQCLVSWGQASGFPIQKVSFESWWRQCNASDELKLLQIYFPEPALAKSRGARVEIKLDIESTDRFLRAEGIHRPPITQELLKSYIAYGAKQLSQGPIVARGREARGEGKKAAPPLVRVAREGDLPLSYAQQRLWFLDQLQPGNAAYNMPVGIRLEG
ncbi:MAG TPA: amino acid adenylation domain-containing protein, partial [Candidatus Angelobacter sp.]